MRKFVLAGGSGFLGRVLADHFATAGNEVVILTRAPGHPGPGSVRDVRWDARTTAGWAVELEGAAAVINLTGRSVDCRYTPRNRREIMASRVESTRAIGEAIGGCRQPPAVWLNASTATIYRHNFGPAWDENGELGATCEARDEFSIGVARAWEGEFQRTPAPRTRKVVLRMAMVLGTSGNSVFPVLRRLVRCGLGGRLGSGRQYVSWIHQADLCRAIEWLVGREDLAGTFNLGAPNPLTNAEMMRTMREVVGMPIGLPAAEWMLELGAFLLRTETELIVKSRRVVPQRLLDSGFGFQFTTFREAVTDLHRRQ